VKTLSATLQAAQRSASSVPYIRAVFADYDVYARRGRFQRHYDGAEAAGFHAAVIAPDGSLVRAHGRDDAVRVAGGGAGAGV
jgi:hypothetical protein